MKRGKTNLSERPTETMVTQPIQRQRQMPSGLRDFEVTQNDEVNSDGKFVHLALLVDAEQ